MSELWVYSEKSNCWDYVVHKYNQLGIQIPSFDIHPDDKKSMTDEYHKLENQFIRCGPIENAIACLFIGKSFVHAGIVKENKVRHVGSKTGLRYDSIKAFEKAGTVVYKIHEDLWQR